MLEERRAELPVGQEHANGRLGIAERPEHIEVGFPYVVGDHFVALRELRYEPRDEVDGLELVANAGRDS